MYGSKESCVGVGGVGLDREVSRQLLLAVSPHAVDAAIVASEKISASRDDTLVALARELEGARYEERLAQRRYEAVDPDKRLVARELERRWEVSLTRVRDLEDKTRTMTQEVEHHPRVDRGELIALARELPRVWNTTATDARPKQRIVRALIQEVIVDIDCQNNATVAVIHWTGGRHTEVRVGRRKVGRYPVGRSPNAVEAVRALAPRWTDWQIAVSLNRMRCKAPDGHSWTELRIRELRETLRIAAYDPVKNPRTTISADEAARRLSICVGSVMRLIREGILPATQVLFGAPWEIPVEALDTDAVRIGLQQIKDRRPTNFRELQDKMTLRLPNM